MRCLSRFLAEVARPVFLPPARAGARAAYATAFGCAEILAFSDELHVVVPMAQLLAGPPPTDQG